MALIALVLALPIAIFIQRLPAPIAPPAEPSVSHLHPPRAEPLSADPAPGASDVPLPSPAPLAPPAAPDLRPLAPAIDPFALPTADGAPWAGAFADLGADALVASLAELDGPPEVLVRTSPRLPYPLKRAQSVLAELTVEVDGRVSSVSILQSDDPRLSSAVTDALRSWRFQPGLRDGEAVRFRMRQRFNFQP